MQPAVQLVPELVRRASLPFSVAAPEESCPAAATDLRLLLVCDCAERLGDLRASLGRNEIEITSAIYPAKPGGSNWSHWSKEYGRSKAIIGLEELRDDFRDYHLAVVDVGPAHLEEVLRTLRRCPACAKASILVEASRIITERSLAGVLPQYRAMACSDLDLIMLVRRRATGEDGRRARRLML